MLSISLFACAALISIAKRKAEKKTVIPSIEYSHPWTTTDFRKNAHELVDFMCEYYETLENKPILSTVNPGYLSKILPTEAPTSPESWQQIFTDVETKIMPGMTHWQHPSFFAYFPANVSYPGMMGEMLSGMFNVIGFSWICSPACTELETIVMDWLCKALGLPETFLSTGKGGGVIQSTASESTLIALLAARTKCIKNGAKAEDLVVYMSDQAHSSVQKACMIAGISNFRILESNKDCQLDRSVLLDQIKVDISKGLTPCFLCATLGTTSTSACDPLDELGLVCQENNIWMHIDAAYVGASFLCEEFRPFMKGIEFANSFAFNPHKWMLTNFECCAMWVKDRKYLLDALDITPEYLRNKASESGLVIDYRSWQIPLGRRFSETI
jgi:aromatic-L-amino-acid decarboxylase